MNSLLPLRQKLGISWSYNSQVFSPAEPSIRGQLGISFQHAVDKITNISFGLCGEYKLEYNNLLLKNDSEVLFNTSKSINIPDASFKKNDQVIEPFTLTFPCDEMYLPSSCLFYGDEQGYDSTLSAKYYLYVKVTQSGSNKGFLSSGKEKVETFTFPLTYQSSSMFQSINVLSYKEYGHYPLTDNKTGLDLVVELVIPSNIDMNIPFFDQFHLKFITKTPTESLHDVQLHLKSFKLSIYYYSLFTKKNSTSKYQRKKNMFQIQLQHSSIRLNNLTYDSVNSHFYQIYNIEEFPKTSLKDLVGLHSFLTNFNLLDGKFSNSSCLHLTFQISDDFNHENTYKFRTESSLNVSSPTINNYKLDNESFNSYKGKEKQ